MWSPSARANELLDPRQQRANTPPPQSTTPGLHPRKHSPDGATRVDIRLQLTIVFYRPRKDKRLSWPSWLTCIRRFTHIGGHLTDAGRAQDKRKFACQRLTFYHCATPPTLYILSSQLVPVKLHVFFLFRIIGSTRAQLLLRRQHNVTEVEFRLSGVGIPVFKALFLINL